MQEVTPSSRVERAFETWSVLMIRYRWLVIALGLLLTAGAVAIAKKKLKVDRSAAAMTYNEGPEQALLDRFESTFGSDDLFLVVVEGDVFTTDFLGKLRSLHEDLARLDVPGITETAKAAPTDQAGAGSGAQDDFGTFEGGDGGATAWSREAGGSTFDEVTSLVNARRTRPAAGGIEVGEWLSPFPETPTAVAALREQAMSDQLLPNRLIGSDGRHAVVVMRTFPLSDKDSDVVLQAVAAVVAKHQAPGFRALLGGAPALRSVYAQTLASDSRRLLLLCFAVIIVVLTLLFRHPAGVLGPAAIILMSALWTLGFMAANDMPITLLSSWLPAFILTVGVGDSIHVLACYRALRQDGMENHAAIRRSMAIAGPPCFLASFLTLVGLLCFSTSSIDAVNNLGTAGGVGGLLAYFITMAILPIVLHFNKKSTLGATVGSSTTRRFRQMLQAGSALTRSRGPRRAVLLVVTLLAAGAAATTVRDLSFRHDRLQWLPQDLETVKAFHMLDERVGGSANVQLLIEVREGHELGEVELVRQLDALDRDIRGYVHPTEGRIVQSSMSFLDILRETNRAVHDADPRQYRLPDQTGTNRELLFLFQSSDRTEYERYVTSTGRAAQITLRVKWLDAVLYQDLIEHIGEAIAANVDPALAEVRPTGSIYIINEHLWKIVRDLSRSFIIALIVMSIWLVIMLRSLRLGFVAMLPNLFPVLLVVGAIAFLGIQVNIGVLLAATVCLGLVIDDTIHFFHHTRILIRDGAEAEAAIKHTLDQAGLPMLMTSIVLTLGFGVFGLADLGMLRTVAGVAAGIIMVAMFLELLLTPALVRVVARRREEFLE